jgi:class 3 adenylate cyclase
VQQTYGIDFRVRAGVHTGPVTVGVIGRGLRNDYVSAGETTSTAARLVALAHGDQIVVSSRTRELADGAFLFAEDTASTSTVLCESCDRVDAEIGLRAGV